MKIAMLSFADINNYGDILFSHVFKMEMEHRIPGIDIDFYSPSEIDLEGLHYQAYLKEKIQNKYDAIVLAGGEVVHLFDERTWQPIYEKQGKNVISKYASDVVWDWADCENSFKAWLSVGVRPFGDKWDEEKVNRTLSELDFISCRGIISKKILEGSDFEKFNPKIHLTPDLGWIFPSYIDHLELRGKLYTKFIPEGTNYLLFQVHNITDSEARAISDKLLKIKREQNLQIVLMPVIHLWEDQIFLNKINDFSGNEFLILPNALTVVEMLDIIVNCKLAITSSLHVAITALADGIPAGIFNKWQGSKLQDLFGLQFRIEALFSDISEFDKLFKRLNDERTNNNSINLYAQFMRAKLSDVFDMFAEKILSFRDDV